MAENATGLPDHIEATIRAISKLHADHQADTTTLQRLTDRLTSWIGRPIFLAGLTLLISAWIGGNLLAAGRAWDPPPFNWLQGALGTAALYVTVLILATQRREDQLGGYRERLTLELAVLSEQKSAKIIFLLEEMRRDSPHLADRVDDEAAAMAVAANPLQFKQGADALDDPVDPLNVSRDCD